MNPCLEDVKKLLKDDELIYFDFSQAPVLLKRKDRDIDEAKIHTADNISRWAKAQGSFVNWTKDKRVFIKEYIESGKIAYDAFFKKRGPLRGNVLDIGGGWGLFRQWWEPGEAGVFIVHDPGVERFLYGPHKLHRYYYKKAFSIPMSFVEGFGEDLPYKDNVFDVCLIAAALDHCLEPQRVMNETYRCLVPGGRILVIQRCYDRYHPNIFKHLLKNLRSPRLLLSKLYNLWFYPTHHLHRFSLRDIILLLEQAGFSKININKNIVASIRNVYAFEAIKNPYDENPFDLPL